MNNVVHGKKIEMVILKNGEEFKDVNEVFKMLKMREEVAEWGGTWGESKDYDGYFICVGKGNYTNRAKHKFGLIFNEYNEKTGEIVEGLIGKDFGFVDICPSRLFNNPSKYGKINIDQILFDHKKEKRIYFTSKNFNNRPPYVFRGVYKLKELRPNFKESPHKVRVWTRISKDWEV